MIKLNYTLILSLLATAILTFSCSKDDDDSSSDHDHNTGGKGTVMLHFHPVVNGNMFNSDSEYQMSNGTRVKFERVNYYVSGISLKEDHDGNTLKSFDDTYFLVSPETMMYSLGEVDAKEYHGVLFNVGVDSTANHSDPSTYATDHPLAPKAPAMHWSWASGYRFIVIEGKYDASADNTGAIDQDFVFHVGTDALLRQIDSGHHHLHVEANETKEVMIEYDLMKFLDGIDIKTQNSTHTMNNLPLATKVADNAKSAFTFED